MRDTKAVLAALATIITFALTVAPLRFSDLATPTVPDTQDSNALLINDGINQGYIHFTHILEEIDFRSFGRNRFTKFWKKSIYEAFGRTTSLITLVK